MSLEQTILAIKREFSGNEKYRLFLQHVNRVEEELQKERKKYTELLQAHTELKEKYKGIQPRLHAAEVELSEYKATESSKKFVNMKAYRRLEQSKIMWETRFWELHRQLEDLKKSTHSGNESL